MTDDSNNKQLSFLSDDGPKEDPSDKLPVIDSTLDLRPDLTELGIIEHEKGVCEDTYENRAILRRARLNWDSVYDQSGSPTGLIVARSAEAMKERRVLSLAEKKPLLSDPTNNNSDYLTGIDLLIDDTACKMTPLWVIGAIRAWQQEQENGGVAKPNRAPLSLPQRCRIVKSDGIRCMMWSSGRVKDDGLCRHHLKTVRKPGEDVERARRKLIQAAPYAVDVLEEMMETAESEPVKLKAATEILDRAGVRGGQDLSVEVEVTDSRPAHVIVAERLQRLASGAANVAASLSPEEITDAEIVEDSTTETLKNNNGDSEEGGQA